MEKKSDTVSSNIDSVVDEIFAEFNATSSQELKKEENQDKKENDTPPPIPLIDDYTIDATEVEVVKEVEKKEPIIIDAVDSSFMDEVLNVINNDIKPKEVTLDLEGIVDNPSKEIDPSPINNNEKVEEINIDNANVSNVEIQERFNIEDNDIIENVTFKSSIEDLNNINNSVEYLLKQQEIKYLKQAQRKIDEFKNNKIKDMQLQINQLTNWFNEYKLNQENNRTKDLNIEQENLKHLYGLLNEITLSQREVKQDFDKIFNLLSNQENNQDE